MIQSKIKDPIISMVKISIFMNLSVSDRALIDRIPHINTKIGVIAVLDFREDIPEGWERLCL